MAACLMLATAAADRAFADSHADRLYYVVFLKRDPARKPLDKEESDRIQRAHIANIQAMADRGVLAAAGPFDDTPPVISGVFFFVTSSMDVARSAAAADPTVVEHRNTIEVLAWRGPAGIGDEYKRLHKQRPEMPAGMGIHPFLILRRANNRRDPVLAAEHSAYWEDLRSAGKVVASGPVEGDPSVAGIVIFNRIPDSEAAALAAADPAVGAGVLTVEAHRWWCAANVFPR